MCFWLLNKVTKIELASTHNRQSTKSIGGNGVRNSDDYSDNAKIKTKATVVEAAAQRGGGGSGGSLLPPLPPWTIFTGPTWY